MVVASGPLHYQAEVVVVAVLLLEGMGMEMVAMDWGMVGWAMVGVEAASLVAGLAGRGR